LADIAGGTGELSLWLQRVGYEPTLYDLRRKLKLGRARKLTYIVNDVSRLHFKPRQYDAIVGMHPDGATWHVLRLAEESKCPFAVIPCCVYPPQGKVVGGDWMEWLSQEAESMGFDVRVDQLHMDGKNLVLKGWPIHG
jgi:hypothetical protein